MTEDRYPAEAVRAELSTQLNLSDKQLQMWFCHRRLKDRKGKDEDSTNVNANVNANANVARKKPRTEKQNMTQYPGAVLASEPGGAAVLPRDQFAEEYQYENSERFTPEVRRCCTSVPDIARVKMLLTLRLSVFRTLSILISSHSWIAFEALKGLQSLITNLPKIVELQQELKPRSRKSGPRDGSFPGKRRNQALSARVAKAEAAAIAAVEAQLGEPLREVGPPLGLEFDPLPPGAFTTHGIDHATLSLSVPCCYQ